MATFPGGSPYAMVREISQGYFLVTERTFQRFSVGELEKLRFEIDRLMREVRGEQPSLEDLPAIQQRNRRLQRLNAALMVMQTYRRKHRI